MADNDESAVAAAQKKNADHDSRFYATGIPEIPPLMHDILTKYSRIPEEEVVDHVVTLRDRAYAIHHYPCIGRYRFLTFSLLRHRLYPSHVLPLLLSPPSPSSPIFLDIGTCLGQDLRLLLYAGVPVPRVHGTDIKPQFLALGYELFRDQDRFPTGNQMAPIDLFDEGSFGAVLTRFGAGVDVLHIAAVFHLFGLEDQRAVARRVLKLLKPAAAGGRRSLLLGSQTGHAKGREYPQRVGGRGETLYRHSDVTWKRMWEQVAEEEGVKVEVGCVLHDVGQEEQKVKGIRTGVNDTAAGSPQHDPEFRMMEFEVWLLDS